MLCNILNTVCEQILYHADISFVLMALNLKPGSICVESGLLFYPCALHALVLSFDESHAFAGPSCSFTKKRLKQALVLVRCRRRLLERLHRTATCTRSNSTAIASRKQRTSLRLLCCADFSPRFAVRIAKRTRSIT